MFRGFFTSLTSIQLGSKSTAQKIIKNIAGYPDANIANLDVMTDVLSKALENTINYSGYQQLNAKEKEEFRKLISKVLLQKADRTIWNNKYLPLVYYKGIKIEGDVDKETDVYIPNTLTLTFPPFFYNQEELETLIRFALKKQFVKNMDSYINLINHSSEENELRKLPVELQMRVAKFAASEGSVNLAHRRKN